MHIVVYFWPLLVPDIVNNQMHCWKICPLQDFSSPPSKWGRGPACPCRVARAYQTHLYSFEVFLPQSAGNKGHPRMSRVLRERRQCNRNHLLECKWLLPSGSFQAWSLLCHFHLIIHYCYSHSMSWLCWADNTPFMMRLSGRMVTQGHSGRCLVPTNSP